MDTAKKTHREIIRFINVATNWLQGEKLDSKLKYAVTRVMKFARKANEDCEEELTRLNIEHAATDEKGRLLTGAGQAFIFTKEELLKRNAAQRLVLDTEVELNTYFAKPPFVVNGLEEEVFAGFVIPELEEPSPNAS